MAACTQRAGTITPVKSSVVTGEAVGLAGMGVGEAGRSVGVRVGEGGIVGLGVNVGSIGDWAGWAGSLIAVLAIAPGVGALRGWQAVMSSGMSMTAQARRRERGERREDRTGKLYPFGFTLP